MPDWDRIPLDGLSCFLCRLLKAHLLEVLYFEIVEIIKILILIIARGLKGLCTLLVLTVLGLSPNCSIVGIVCPVIGRASWGNLRRIFKLTVSSYHFLIYLCLIIVVTLLSRVSCTPKLDHSRFNIFSLTLVDQSRCKTVKLLVNSQKARAMVILVYASL